MITERKWVVYYLKAFFLSFLEKIHKVLEFPSPLQNDKIRFQQLFLIGYNFSTTTITVYEVRGYCV